MSDAQVHFSNEDRDSERLSCFSLQNKHPLMLEADSMFWCQCHWTEEKAAGALKGTGKRKIYRTVIVERR